MVKWLLLCLFRSGHTTIKRYTLYKKFLLLFFFFHFCSLFFFSRNCETVSHSLVSRHCVWGEQQRGLLRAWRPQLGEQQQGLLRARPPPLGKQQRGLLPLLDWVGSHDSKTHYLSYFGGNNGNNDNLHCYVPVVCCCRVGCFESAAANFGDGSPTGEVRGSRSCCCCCSTSGAGF